MTFRYLDDIATADIAFQAGGRTLDEVFVAAADATMNVMVEDLDSIHPTQDVKFTLTDEDLDLLLYQYLSEILFLKDTRRILIRIERALVSAINGLFTVTAEGYGEEVNPATHSLIVDVKAVTLHRFNLMESGGGWEATVVLDV